MTANAQPLYAQFDHVPVPDRFVTIVEAYLAIIREQVPDLSARKLLSEANVSHGILHALRINTGRQPDLKSVGKIVDALNHYLPQSEKWPVEKAVAAAGYTPEDSTKIIPTPLMPKRARADQHDLMPRVSASLSMPIFSFDALVENGLERSQLSRKHFNASTDMGILIGRIPGYPLQRSADEWVIFLRPEADRHAPDDAYALVRTDAHEVRAHPRQSHTRSQVIGWLIGVIYLPGSLADDGAAIFDR